MLISLMDYNLLNHSATLMISVYQRINLQIVSVDSTLRGEMVTVVYVYCNNNFSN